MRATDCGYFVSGTTRNFGYDENMLALLLTVVAYYAATPMCDYDANAMRVGELCHTVVCERRCANADVRTQVSVS